jgi:hypothetical protein
MNRLALLGVVLVCVIVPATVMADEFRDYPEFRYASGLPGGSNGVTPEGNLGFAGAFQLNIPVGYTPGWGNFMTTASSAAINGGFPTGYAGANHNGTLTFGFGMLDKYSVWFSSMGTGKGADGLEPAENVQIEVVPESKNWPGISVGVVDLFNRRASSLDRPFEGAGRSFFVAATREAGSPEKPLYYTVGFGSGRFHNRPFGGVSYQPLDRVQVFAEYDGWVGNVGGAYDLVSSRQWHCIGGLSLVDFSRIDLTLSVTKTNF